MAAPDGWEVRLGPPDKTRAQRAMFHVLCENIGKELGCTPGEVKQYVKQYHYGIDEKKVGNMWYKSVRSTEDDNKVQYTALIEAAHRWAAENGLGAQD